MNARKTANGINLTMLCDFYELTMGNGYFMSDKKDTISYFDVFFRNVPDGGGFAVAAGLEQIVDYIQNLHFSEEDIAYLRSRGIFDEGFLNYLKDFFGARRPASFKTVCLLEKEGRQTNSFQADYLGFRIPNEFVVGYGLDYADHYRNLPYIGVLKKECYID